jgi:hypothetical protein
LGSANALPNLQIAVFADTLGNSDRSICAAISFSVYQVSSMAVLSSLETVANVTNIPRERLVLLAPECQMLPCLPVGQVGTIVEVYGEESPQYLVEFADLDGREYAMATLQPHEVLALHYELPLAS